MATYFTTLDTSEGQINVLTKSHWMGFLTMPRTSVMPQNAADLRRLGTSVRWTTSEPAKLARLHEAVVRLVQEVSPSGLVEVANSAKMTGRVARSFGGSWRDVVRQAAKDGAPFPVPEDVLQYIKTFA